MSKSTKSRRASKSTPPPATFDGSLDLRIREQLADPDGRLYHPGLAEWVSPPERSGQDATLFEIREWPDDSKPGPGRVVATVRVNPEIGTPRDRMAIATMLSAAPELWRELRRLAPWIEDGADKAMNVGRIVQLLWQAAGERPFGHREIDCDEDLAVKKMRRCGYAVNDQAAAEAERLNDR